MLLLPARLVPLHVLPLLCVILAKLFLVLPGMHVILCLASLSAARAAAVAARCACRSLLRAAEACVGWA